MAKKRKSVSKSKPAAPRSNGAPSGSVPADIKDLYQFMLDNGLQTLEFDKKDYHVRLVRKGAAAMPVPVPVYAQGAAPGPVASPSEGSAQAVPAGAPALPANTISVKSPMMGVFYRASSPSSPPFVKEGDKIKPGDVIALIEAMKVFNDLKSEISGKVVKILVDNGKPVKVGQEIFWIERG